MMLVNLKITLQLRKGLRLLVIQFITQACYDTTNDWSYAFVSPEVHLDVIPLSRLYPLSYQYRPPTKLREGNVFTGVCLSFCLGGGVHM